MKKAAETIVDCLKESDMTQSQLATALGEDRRVVNQQINRVKDLKVERFVDILAHIGFRVEVVSNGGIKKVCKKLANDIIESKMPTGKFWYEDNGLFVGVDNAHSCAFVETFADKNECIKWLKGKPSIDANGYTHDSVV